MQTIKQSSRNLQVNALSWLALCGCLLVQLFISTSAFANKSKAEQTRPQPKTPPKVLASRRNTRLPAPERKGKKGMTSQPEPATPRKKGLKPEPVAAARSPRGQEAKPKSQPRAQRAHEKPVLTKASTKTNSKTLAASQSARLSEQPLSSRLTRVSFTSATPVKPQAESDRRGKFGKKEISTTPSHERAAERDDEKTVASIQPIRPNETTQQREAERNPGRNSERSATMPATRPREANTATDTPGYQIQLPDQIEVIEYGSTSPTVAKLLTLPESRPLTPFGAIVTKTNTPPNKRSDLAIPQQRVLEIQYELVKRGFYNAEPNGLYDEATILAMWEFQKNYGLPATGYPSAHALKRLGLTSW